MVKKLLKNIEDESIFEKKEDKIWICRNCGHVYVGTKALERLWAIPVLAS